MYSFKTELVGRLNRERDMKPARWKLARKTNQKLSKPVKTMMLANIKASKERKKNEKIEDDMDKFQAKCYLLYFRQAS